MLHTQESVQQFTGETLSPAVLDSGATSTVCGKTWIDCYEETLSDEDRLKVKSQAQQISSLVMVETLHLLKKLPYQQRSVNSLSELELML